MNKIYFFLLFGLTVHAQPRAYKVSNAHSHNDYEQRIPFWMAYNSGFGSIEADIFLQGNLLLVAHDTGELKRKMTLENAYLKPLISCLNKNNEFPFSDTSKKLQLLIDVKTDSINTLNALILLLRKYPSLIRSNAIKLVITGNRPDESLFPEYPSFIMFDGELHKNYSVDALNKISLFSDDFKNYSQWNGKNKFPEKDDSIMRAAVKKSHELKKPVRFWDAPDNEMAWYYLMGLQVDYINTDHIQLLADFLNNMKVHY